MSGQKSDLSRKRIIGLFPELLGIGGVQEAGRLTAAAIQRSASRLGWSVDFLGLNDPKGSHSFGIAEINVSFQGFGRAKAAFVFAAIRHARALTNGINDAVVAAHPNLAPAVGWMKSTHGPLRAIVMSHGIEVWQPLPYLRRHALTAADVVLAPSRDTAQKLADVQGVSPLKIHRLPWPLNPAFLRLAETPASLCCPAAFSNRPVILTVGRWSASERYKGADDLIAAVAELSVEFPSVSLAAVGGGNDLPRLRKLADNLGLSQRIHFLENLTREEVAACYAHADIFALPSAGEGFGIVFLEAMAFSKAVVAASSGGALDVIEDNVNGLLVPRHDSKQLACALRRVLGDDALRERLGHRGREIVTEKYRFEGFANELERILEPA